MALELNGTTGVSLVQDGVVTAADLSSTLDLTGKTVTLPAGVGGKVVKISMYRRTTSYESSSSTYSRPTEFDVDYTMQDSSNKIYFYFAGNMYRGTQNGGIEGYLSFDGASRGETQVRYVTANDNDRTTLGSTILDGYTGSKNFGAWIRSTPNNSKAGFAGNSSLVIMEYTP